ncbi:ATP-dependent Clp protease proteolytic subunit [Streptomyces coeruleorubidus]|uniref:ATP-dependent Clp protease proteolytic subunit n=1 Tax=Streptomyces coeruleorubidus TaxID=116188 RepID=UPI0033B0D13A
MWPAPTGPSTRSPSTPVTETWRSPCVTSICPAGSLLLGCTARPHRSSRTGTPGKRFALPNTRMTLHLPAFGLTANPRSTANRPEELQYTQQRIAQLIAQHHPPRNRTDPPRLRRRPLVQP